MDNKMICVLAGYDDATEARLSGIQKDLYAAGFSGFRKTTFCSSRPKSARRCWR